MVTPTSQNRHSAPKSFTIESFYNHLTTREEKYPYTPTINIIQCRCHPKLTSAPYKPSSMVGPVPISSPQHPPIHLAYNSCISLSSAAHKALCSGSRVWGFFGKVDWTPISRWVQLWHCHDVAKMTSLLWLPIHPHRLHSSSSTQLEGWSMLNCCGGCRVCGRGGWIEYSCPGCSRHCGHELSQKLSWHWHYSSSIYTFSLSGQKISVIQRKDKRLTKII